MLALDVKKQLPVINDNFDLVKAELNKTIAKYKGIAVTEEGLADCKLIQKELAGMRVKVDTFRKNVKKEMSGPIVTFEDKCKELIKLIEDTENPIKEGIETFNEVRREANREEAQKAIDGFIIKYELNTKYSPQLTVLDKYTNLTAKSKDTLVDIMDRAQMLREQQDKDLEMLFMIKDAIEAANKTITLPLAIEDFKSLIEMGMSAREVIQEINKRAERIRKAELQAIEDKRLEEERIKAEEEAKIAKEIEDKRIAAEIEEEAKRIDSLPVEKVIEEIIEEPIKTPIIINTMSEEATKEFEEVPFSNFDFEEEIPTGDTIFFKTIKITGTKQEVVTAECILNENDIDFDVIDEGEKVNE